MTADFALKWFHQQSTIITFDLAVMVVIAIFPLVEITYYRQTLKRCASSGWLLCKRELTQPTTVIANQLPNATALSTLRLLIRSPPVLPHQRTTAVGSRTPPAQGLAPSTPIQAYQTPIVSYFPNQTVQKYLAFEEMKSVPIVAAPIPYGPASIWELRCALNAREYIDHWVCT